MSTHGRYDAVVIKTQTGSRQTCCCFCACRCYTWYWFNSLLSDLPEVIVLLSLLNGEQKQRLPDVLNSLSTVEHTFYHDFPGLLHVKRHLQAGRLLSRSIGRGLLMFIVHRESNHCALGF